MKNICEDCINEYHCRKARLDTYSCPNYMYGTPQQRRPHIYGIKVD